MPNRIIKESICTSDNIDQLSAFQETMFYRLIVNCDDYGRMDARPKILASKLFPLKDIRTAQIEDGLRALTSAELVIIYEVDGKPFLQMKTWERHQQIRAKKSKYPSPESGKNVSDSICNQMIADDSKCPRNPIQSESESNPNPKDVCAALDANFETFWNAYPRHTNKKAAQSAFNKINPDADLLNIMLQSLAAWSKSPQWTKDGGQFIPHPATWLNGRRWEDEMPKGGGPVKTVSAQQYSQRHYTEEELLGVSDDLIAEARKQRDTA
jgi:hypothetical protein